MRACSPCKTELLQWGLNKRLRNQRSSNFNKSLSLSLASQLNLCGHNNSVSRFLSSRSFLCHSLFLSVSPLYLSFLCLSLFLGLIMFLTRENVSYWLNYYTWRNNSCSASGRRAILVWFRTGVPLFIFQLKPCGAKVQDKIVLRWIFIHRIHKISSCCVGPCHCKRFDFHEWWAFKGCHGGGSCSTPG